MDTVGRNTAPRRGHAGGRALALAASAAATAALIAAATAAAVVQRTALDPVTVTIIPISNTRPLDVGIKKGFFEQQNIEIKKVVLQSGNDIVLALANSKTDIGFAGWVPAMIARTQGVPITTVATSEVEGTSLADNWQNIIVKGSSSIRTPQDLAGKTIAVNALKGVGEVMIRAALDKLGIDSASVKLLPVPFPAMRTALANGQVDAIWTPEPFLSQAINLDGARDLMAPGPVLGRFFPIGGYFARTDWVASNQDLARRFRLAMNQSLTYSQGNSAEVRALAPALPANVRLPIWTTIVDRAQLLQLARYAKKYGAISSLPNFTQLVPSAIEGGKTLQGTVGDKFITLRQDGRLVSTLKAGKYTVVVSDTSKTQNFQLVGPGVNRKTGVPGTGRATWSVTLKKGVYRYSSSARPAQKRMVTVS
jgi:NitT/TauT family transport system substrate-binding protein